MKEIFKKLLLVVGVGVGVLISAVLISTMQLASENTDLQLEAVAVPTIDHDNTPQRLAEALRFMTTSYQDPTKFDGETFYSLHKYLEEVFPDVHTTLKREIVNDFSLLYSWEGSDPTLSPILLMAHQDVVPVIPGTEEDWDYPPFDGTIADGYVWGRGALDTKSSLMGIMEAIELLLLDGFKPRRTVYIAFGHDEEIGGKQGAAKIAELLRSRGIRLEYVLDEGGSIIQNIMPGVSSPVAFVGIAEKGYVSLEITARAEGGHSSMPPKHTAVGVVSRAIIRIEDNPFPANMVYASRFLEYVGPKMPFGKKVIFANLWLFSSLVERILSRSPEMNAGIRTTTAVTMFSGSSKENVLAIKATAIVNFRVMPGESIAYVVDRVKRIVDDPRVQVRPEVEGFSCEASSVSDINSKSYKMLRNTILQVAADKELIVSPYLVLGATDSRYFTGMSDNVYRFAFSKLGHDDLKRIHGTNERISVDNYLQLITFYCQLIRNSNELRN